MARTFVRASSQYLEISQAVVTAVPLTMACWFNSSDTTNAQCLMCIGDTDTIAKFVMTLRPDLANDPVQVSTRSVSTNAQAVSTTGYSASTWHHACGVFTSITSRSAFIDGGSKGSEGTSATPASLDRTAIGRENDSTPADHMSGLIAEAAIWNVALTDAQVFSLSRGYSPLLIAPDSLVAYWPLIGNDSPETDVVGGFNLTVTGATVGSHCRVFKARRT